MGIGRVGGCGVEESGGCTEREGEREGGREGGREGEREREGGREGGKERGGREGAGKLRFSETVTPKPI